MRTFVRLLAIALALVLAFAFLGPMAPEGTFVRDWAVGMREAMNAWWGFPMGLPGS